MGCENTNRITPPKRSLMKRGWIVTVLRVACSRDRCENWSGYYTCTHLYPMKVGNHERKTQLSAKRQKLVSPWEWSSLLSLWTIWIWDLFPTWVVSLMLPGSLVPVKDFTVLTHKVHKRPSGLDENWHLHIGVHGSQPEKCRALFQ